LAVVDVPPDGSGESPSDEREDEPKELSSRGLIVVRSSSHPPRTKGQGTAEDRDHSGARSLPLSSDPGAVEARPKRTTPSERPRRRREVQARTLDRARIDTPRSRPGARRRSDPAQLAVQPSSERVQPTQPGAPSVDRHENVRALASRSRRLLFVLALIVAGAAVWLALRG
jgi:hypothetical protein